MHVYGVHNSPNIHAREKKKIKREKKKQATNMEYGMTNNSMCHANKSCKTPPKNS